MKNKNNMKNKKTKTTKTKLADERVKEILEKPTLEERQKEFFRQISQILK